MQWLRALTGQPLPIRDARLQRVSDALQARTQTLAHVWCAAPLSFGHQLEEAPPLPTPLSLVFTGQAETVKVSLHSAHHRVLCMPLRGIERG